MRAASELCSSRAHATAPANSATAALFGDDLDDGHVAEVLAPAKTKKRVTINLFGDESVNDTIDVSDAIEMATGETTEFIDPDDVATLNKQRLVDNIFNMMPAEWDEFFLSYSRSLEVTLPAERRKRTAKRLLMDMSEGQVKSAWRFVRHYVSYLTANELPRATFTCDAMIEALELYRSTAKAAAADRTAKNAARGKRATRDRGGATATMPVFLGARVIRKACGLPFELNDDVKEARA